MTDTEPVLFAEPDLPADEEPTPIPDGEALAGDEPPPSHPPAPPPSAGPTLTLALAALTGLMTGLLAALLLQAIPSLRLFSAGPLLEPVSFLQPYVVVLVPALGGLLVGLIARVAPEVRSTGVSEVMAAIAWPRRALRPRAALARPLAALLTIGTGGSAGPEGPIAHGGAALVAWLTTALGLSPIRQRTLLACASAGAIAAVFDAPLAGLAFALEVVLGGFSASALWTGNWATWGALLVSAVSATVARRALLAAPTLIPTVKYPTWQPADLFLAAGLGAAAGVVAVLFAWVLTVAEDVFGGWRLPAFLRPALGGLAVGILAFLLPQEGLPSALLGPGFAALDTILRADGVWTTLALLVVLKGTATALTVGSGGSGDVFTPALVIGGALGGAWGALAGQLFPGLAGPAHGLALAGAVAVLAGAAHAPFTAILLGWQLADGEIHILPALVIAALTARWVAGRLDPASIYTTRLERQGLRLCAGYDAAVLDTITLADVLGAPEPTPIPRTDDLALAQAPVARPTDTLAQALQTLDQADADRLLVTDPMLPGRLLGIVRRADIEDAARET